MAWDYTRDKRRDNVNLRKREKTRERVRESDIHTERQGVLVFVIRHTKTDRLTG